MAGVQPSGAGRPNLDGDGRTNVLRVNAGVRVRMTDLLVTGGRAEWGDGRRRLCAEEGPALAYADGTAAWALDGILVPEHVVSHPERITIAEIDSQPNAEVRRVLIERFGAERLVREGGAELVSEDGMGRLWRRPLPEARWGDEPVVVVEVLNATPEAAGSRRTYFLRVPPSVRSAAGAVAWTFGMSEEEYAPADET